LKNRWQEHIDLRCKQKLRTALAFIPTVRVNVIETNRMELNLAQSVKVETTAVIENGVFN
jgi:hypothetical protein